MPSQFAIDFTLIAGFTLACILGVLSGVLGVIAAIWWLDRRPAAGDDDGATSKATPRVEQAIERKVALSEGRDPQLKL